MAETIKIFDGYKTYAACVLTVILSAVGFYYGKVTLEVLIYTVLGALIFISNRMGNKADTQKVIESNKEHLDKAIAIVPCDAQVTPNSLNEIRSSIDVLNKAVDSIINSPKNQS